jgi:hypothetical protein
MKDLSTSFRGYILSHLAWYAEANKITQPTITFGLFDQQEQGCTDGEMIMRWREVGGEMAARLDCYDDALAVLHSFADVIGELAEFDSCLLVGDFITVLQNCGFKDLTEYENPNPNRFGRGQQLISQQASLAPGGSARFEGS